METKPKRMTNTKASVSDSRTLNYLIKKVISKSNKRAVLSKKIGSAVLMRLETPVHGCLLSACVIWLCACVRWWSRACVMYVHLGFLVFFQCYLVVFIRTIIRKNPIHQLNKIKKKYRKGLVKSNVRKFGSSSNSGAQKSHWKGNVSARTAL